MQPHRTKSLDLLKLGQYPDAVRQSRVWLGWCWVGQTKVPIDVETGEYARTNDPSTWSTQERAITAYRNGTLEGVGHARIDDQVFIDGDGCVVNGRILPWAQEIIHALNTYAEFSPNDGIHIIARGKLPPGKRQFSFNDRPHHGIAFYDGNRYFTATGRRITSHSDIRESPALLEIWKQYCGGSKTAGETRREIRVSVPDNDADQQLIERASRSRDRGFRRLWAGDWENDYPSQSEADFALLRKLGFWTGNDRERMERLFSLSALANRAKWEEREDYREITILRAIEMTEDTWKSEE
jgi:primase-polymerase (primpol)-like protein